LIHLNNKMFFTKFIISIFAIYFVLLIFLYFYQRKLLYHPTVNSYTEINNLIPKIEKVNSFLRSQGKPDYIDEITIIKDKEIDISGNDNNKKDELYFKALDIIKLEKKASTSFLQRKLQIGYNRAARIMETMEKEGIVGKANHVGKREIL